MKKSRLAAITALFLILTLLAGCYTIKIDIPVPAGAGGQTTPNSVTPTAPSSSYAAPETTIPTVTVPTAPLPTDASTLPTPSATAPDAQTPETPKDPAAMQGAELLQFFNNALNRIKTEKVGFKKNKLTSILDLELSNSAANTLVGLVKSSLLSETGDETVVPKGGDSINVMGPSGKPYVSTLTMDDLTSIRCEKTGDNVYVISLAVKGETNPTMNGSIMSRGFDFITVDDVVTTYAPKVGATVARDDIEVVFSDCTATLTVTGDGTVLSYSTYVKGVMNMNNASIKKVITIATDLAVTLASTTDYTAFQY